MLNCWLCECHDCLSIICILRGSKTPGWCIQPHPTLSQKAEQGMSHTDIQQRGQGASLPDTSLKQFQLGDKTINFGCSIGVAQKEPHPFKKTFPKAHLLQNSCEKASIKGVICLSKIAEDHTTCDATQVQQSREGLEKDNVIPHMSPLEKGSLLRAYKPL
jgi:hypothetical protein